MLVQQTISIHQQACSDICALLQQLQSISMAEERQGEAHVDGLAKLSGMQAQAALQQALAIANAPAAAASVAAANLGAYGGGFGQGPAAVQPANGLAALQVRKCAQSFLRHMMKSGSWN